MLKFENGAKVVFLGDSITAKGTWIRRILEYYRQNTDIRFEVINAGVSGDNATDAARRLYETVLVFEPTDVVMMFGMNDVSHMYYGVPATSECIVDRRAMLDRCIVGIKNIANQLLSRGIRVILCSPTPYDEISDIEAPNRMGVQAALYEIGERVKVFAEEKGLPVVDFNRPMLSLMKKLYKTDETFIGADRVHPESEGHEIMAAIFLKTQGFDVEIPETFSEMRALAARPFDEWEEKRYALERRVVVPKFIDRCLFGGTKKTENVKKQAMDLKNNTLTPFFEMAIDSYFDYSENRETYVKELIDYNKTIYD